MLNVTNENLHMYVFTMIGLLIICFAVIFYVKSNMEVEIDSLKKKIRKVTQIQKLMYIQKQKETILEQRRAEEEERREMEVSDEDSYIDPIE